MQNYKTIDPGQCFPFYTYDEDGSHRRENITDWALGEFRAKVKPNSPSYGAKRNRRGLGGG
ncbi:MAG TPA: type ISP restriction/modification enzyme, partial [Candidatus Kapabacteria bacterium]|nr:type ISP restriction/modification enzyme [Candidatus Kapabacteria bacterium]